jgi:hypothetical protein
VLQEPSRVQQLARAYAEWLNSESTAEAAEVVQAAEKWDDKPLSDRQTCDVCSADLGL